MSVTGKTQDAGHRAVDLSSVASKFFDAGGKLIAGSEKEFLGLFARFRSRDILGIPGAIIWERVSAEEEPLVTRYYDAISDVVAPHLDEEDRQARLIRARRLFPDLSATNAEALVGTIEWDHR